MLLKTFRVGETWGDEARQRATKIPHSLTIAPLYLLFKEHMVWKVSRPVASAGKGQNDQMSKVVSPLLEPVANNFSGGMEANSTPDVLSSIDQLNGRVGDFEEIHLEAENKELDNLVHIDSEVEETDILISCQVSGKVKMSHDEVVASDNECADMNSLVSNRVDLCGVTVEQSNGFSRDSHENGTPVWQDEHPQMKAPINEGENIDEVESTPTDDDKDHSSEETNSRSSKIR